MSNDSCSANYSDLLNSQNLYSEAFKRNPELAEKAIDPGSCKKSNETVDSTSNSTTNTDGTVVVSVWGGGGGGGSTTETNKTYQASSTSSEGCSAIAAQYCLSVAVSNGLNCAVSNTKSEARTTGQQIQTIKISFEDSTIGGSLNIDSNQQSSISGEIIDFSNQSLQQNMAKDVQTQLKNLQTSSQSTEAKNLNFAPTGSQKLFSDAVTGAVSSSSTTTTSNIIKSTITQLFQKQGSTVTLKGLDIKGDATISQMQVAAQEFVIKQMTDNIVGSMMTVKTVNVSDNTQENDQSTKVEGRKVLEAPETRDLNKKSGGGGSRTVLLLFMLMFLCAFSIVQIPPKIRAVSFYIACIMFLTLILISYSNHKVVMVFSIIFFVIASIVNIKRWGETQNVGGGFTDGTLPFPKDGAPPMMMPGPGTSTPMMPNMQGRMKQQRRPGTPGMTVNPMVAPGMTQRRQQSPPTAGTSTVAPSMTGMTTQRRRQQSPPTAVTSASTGRT